VDNLKEKTDHELFKLAFPDFGELAKTNSPLWEEIQRRIHRGEG